MPEVQPLSQNTDLSVYTHGSEIAESDNAFQTILSKDNSLSPLLVIAAPSLFAWFLFPRCHLLLMSSLMRWTDVIDVGHLALIRTGLAGAWQL